MSMKRSLLTLLLALAPFQAFAEARISTYLEGTLVHKSRNEWVVATAEGTYWINVKRPPSWHRRYDDGHISFWVQTKQIKRFRTAGQLKIAALE